METILVKTLKPGICLVEFNRPEAMNALNSEVLKALDEILNTLEKDPEIMGIVVSGAGKAFIAGADIRELSLLSQEQAVNLARKGQQLFSRIENFPKPVIAAINGFALGGGCELAMSCHIRIACLNAKLGQPEVNLGIIPGYGGTQRLAQLVGRGKALELLMTGDMVPAEEAKNLGLVNHVVPTVEELIPFCLGILDKIIAKGPRAITNVIQSVNAGYSFEDSGYTREAELFGECASTEDFKEGTQAFLEKRKPLFKGK